MVTVLYVKGVSEAFTRILKEHEICTTVKPHTTLRNLLVHAKDRIAALPSYHIANAADNPPSLSSSLFPFFFLSLPFLPFPEA